MATRMTPYSRSPPPRPSGFLPDIAPQRGDDLPLEQLDAAAVVGGLGEVEDAVAEARLLQRAEVLDDLLRGAARGHPADRAQRALRLLLADEGHQAGLRGLHPLLHLGLVPADRHVVVGGAHDRVEVGADVAAVLAQQL